MANSKKPVTPDAFDFIAGLQSLLGSLPPEEQRREAMAAFNELISFLTGLREKFNALPTREDAAKLQPSLSRLEELFRYTEKSSATTQSANLNQKPKKSSDIDVSALGEAIKRLPADEITSRLDNKQYLASTIKAVAVELGMKPGSKENKTVLISRIVNYIENARMSDRLAGRTDSEGATTKQDEATPKESAAFPS